MVTWPCMSPAPQPPGASAHRACTPPPPAQPAFPASPCSSRISSRNPWGTHSQAPWKSVPPSASPLRLPLVTSPCSAPPSVGTPSVGRPARPAGNGQASRSPRFLCVCCLRCDRLRPFLEDEDCHYHGVSPALAEDLTRSQSLLPFLLRTHKRTNVLR